MKVFTENNYRDNSWQGRSKNQAESSYKGCGVALIAGIIMFILSCIIAWI